MADIANSTMFTNGIVSSGTSDLLQRAFQQVVDDEDQENDFVTFLQSDGTESQTIHLTPAQAAALGLTFEMDSGEEVSDRITYQEDQNEMITDLEKDFNVQSVDRAQLEESASSQGTIKVEQVTSVRSKLIQESANKEPTTMECSNFEEWPSQVSAQDIEFKDEPLGEDMRLDEINLSRNDSSQNNVAEQRSNSIERRTNRQMVLLSQQKLNATRPDETRALNSIKNNVQYSFDENQVQAQQVGATIQNSQAQILQRLPVILPSSQFIIKPAQTILKPAKNIRILPNTSKINGGTVNAISTMHSINTANQNSILLPKAALLNTLSPQLIKATPIATQLLNTNNISAQLLNTCEISNQVIDASHISTSIVNGTPASTQNILSSQARLSPVLKSTQSVAQKGNVHQILTPIIKGVSGASQVLKSAQVLNNVNLKTTISAPFLKSVQIPAQMLKASAAVVKNTTVAPTLTKTTVNSGTPVIFRSASIVKTQDLKTATTSSTSILRPTQVISTPISILKPQTKVAFNNSTKQGLILNSQNISGFTSNLQTTTLKQGTSMNQQNGLESVKSVQNGIAKQKPNISVNGTTVRIGKKAKPVTLQKPVTAAAEKTDTSKPLGSSENPIQIVQQGHTFHSMQRLTQSQLKQIAHVLQQRSQETAMPNERIVYRVVFPEELDLRIRSPGNLVKGRGGKRGRPKKNAVRPSVLPSKPPIVLDEEQEELKDERKTMIARTRSGRLSRPPRHIVRDYKHLHHLDFMQPDLDDSDGGYSDYNTNSDKLEEEESPKELLTGLEVPKRKISDHFRCPTCNKIYLGRTRMARHFEMHPDHGSPEQLPPPTPEPELKQTPTQDPLKRKGKKRGPWAYVTPEAKSERRQMKLKEAISVCENLEIIKIAAKPVLDAQSLFELLVLKSDSNVRTFLGELKELMDKIREKAGIMLTVSNDDEKRNKDVIDLNEELLCDALGLNPGLYKINTGALKKDEERTCSNDEPPLKLQKIEHSEESKENMDERMSSRFSESSDLSVSDFLSERKTDSAANNCPEVLTALTLMPRNPSPVNVAKTNNKMNNASKLLISSPEIQNQISENPGFQKVDISTTKASSFQKLETLKDSYAKLGENLERTSCSQVFAKLDSNYEQAKLEPLEQAFIKLKPMEQSFNKLEDVTANAYQKQSVQGFCKIQSGFGSVENGSQNFAKGFQKLVSKIVPMTTTDLNCIKIQGTTLDSSSSKMLSTSAICKISDSLPILQDTVPIISSNCDSSIFGSTENLDMSKITNYDHISHLDILNTSGVIDKNLMIDEKLAEQLHLVDQSNLVDELVSERLKNIMPDNILENNLMSNNSNLDTDLDFEALSEEFNRNTRS